MSTYFSATRHPWSSFLFLTPLLALYEAGIWWLGAAQAGQVRNGADAWMRWGLDIFGVGQVIAAPLIVVLVLLVWSWWRWSDRPDDPLSTFFGMAFESCLFACILWHFSRNFGSIMDLMGVKLQIVVVQTAPLSRILTFIGAGIYEEVLFRLGVFVGIYLLLRTIRLPVLIALVLAAVSGAIVFALAHHIGPYGEPMRSDYFVFRTMAGLYFTLLFITRGFGIAVGAHAGYDILVGLSVG
jgi:hypothetical protein